jgi:hypothetical protein
MLLWFDGAAELGIYLVIVAGRPAMGKSAFAAQIALLKFSCRTACEPSIEYSASPIGNF